VTESSYYDCTKIVQSVSKAVVAFTINKELRTWDSILQDLAHRRQAYHTAWYCV